MTIRAYSTAGEREPQSIVWYVLNPSDDPAIVEALRTTDARDRGILLVRLSPAARSMADLARDAFRALKVTGKDITRAGIGDEVLPSLVRYRLCGLGITVLAIDCPHPLAPAQLRLARQWCDHLRARLVLVSRQPTVRPYLTTTVAEVLQTPRLPAPSPTRSWPALDPAALPNDDFPTFRAACRRRVPEHAEVIDDLYRDAYQRARDQLRQPHRSGHDNTAMALFHALTLQDPPPAARLIALRATQACVFTLAGLFVERLRPVRWTAWHTLPGTATPRHHLSGIRRVPDPLSAVANLLLGHYEIGPAVMGSLPNDALVLDDTHSTSVGTVTAPSLLVGSLVLRLPEWSLPFLRAYRCQRDHGSSAIGRSQSTLLCLPCSTASDFFAAARCTQYPAPESSRILSTFPRDTHGEFLNYPHTWHRDEPLRHWMVRRHLYLRTSMRHYFPHTGAGDVGP